MLGLPGSSNDSLPEVQHQLITITAASEQEWLAHELEQVRTEFRRRTHSSDRLRWLYSLLVFELPGLLSHLFPAKVAALVLGSEVAVSLAVFEVRSEFVTVDAEFAATASTRLSSRFRP